MSEHGDAGEGDSAKRPEEAQYQDPIAQASGAAEPERTSPPQDANGWLGLPSEPAEPPSDHPASQAAPTQSMGQEESPALVTRSQEPRKASKAKSGGTRWRDQWLWMWPVGTLLIMVWASSIWGSLGTFISAAIAISTIALFVGDIALGTKLRIAIAVAAALATAAALVAHDRNVTFFSAKPRTNNAVGATQPNKKVLDLRGKKVTLTDLKGKNLHGALLAGATLDGLDLYGMDLTGIVAPGASFRQAILDRARLSSADLRGTDLSRACLHGADLTNADLNGVNAAGADVTDVRLDPAATRRAAVWPSSKGGRATATCG